MSQKLRLRIGPRALQETLSEIGRKKANEHSHLIVAYRANSPYAIASLQRKGERAPEDGIIFRSFTPNANGDLFHANAPDTWSSDARFEGVVGAAWGVKDLVGTSALGNPVYLAPKLNEAELKMLFENRDFQKVLESTQISIKGVPIQNVSSRRKLQPRARTYSSFADIQMTNVDRVERALIADPTLFSEGDKSRIYQKFPSIKRPELRRISNAWAKRNGIY